MTTTDTRPAIDRGTCEALDAADPLAQFRERFDLPEGVVYLDGNSLGALPRDTPEFVQHVIREEWGTGLIRSWNDAGWFDKPQAVGDLVAPIVGAGAGEVVLGDSTSASLFQAVVAAARLRPGRRTIAAERGNFPTDLYMLESVQELLGGAEPRQRRLIADDGPTLDEVLDDDVAVVVLTHVDYRTGRMHDMAEVTRRVHAAGALVVWDLCHSAGAVPVDLRGADADFAVGCTYKYLNGGPGSPSFIWAARQHQADARPALTGWHGHARPFDFTVGYAPAAGITRFRVGTPQLLSVAGLEASLRMWAEVDMAEVREKSLRLTELFIALVDARLSPHWDVEVVTPRESARRGSQVSLRVSDGYPIMQALIERGVIGDFRAPDLIRFGFTPLYTSHADVWDAIAALEDILRTEVWREPRFSQRGAVT
ncbi:kynureninase [Microbacterium sp. NPDC057659]|uniref:kynureninase n=1 Tax=Microbacterium sp. NPDC057659 TaxID=3346198 RepID=UPI00367298DA